jgi:hypothetical protein
MIQYVTYLQKQNSITFHNYLETNKLTTKKASPSKTLELASIGQKCDRIKFFSDNASKNSLHRLTEAHLSAA